MNETNTIQHLKECASVEEIMNVFEDVINKENTNKVEQVMKQYRKELLAYIEQQGKSVDCIDYLIYKIENTL